MKIDMHCHTKEGSLDAHVSIEEYIRRLRAQGFDGMLVTDHDSYNGYREWKKKIKGKKYRNFTVFKGIEYDTQDAGHIIVVMPEDINLNLLETRGLPVQILIPVVHNYGGILGPAHPCGEKYMSFMNAKAYERNPDILKEFDFMEVFNASEPMEANEKARQIAAKYHLPGTGGSDSHKTDSIGTAYTLLPDDIDCESKLIDYIKSKQTTVCGGCIYRHTARDRVRPFNRLYETSFWIYNKLGGWFRAISRNYNIKNGFVEHVNVSKKKTKKKAGGQLQEEKIS